MTTHPTDITAQEVVAAVLQVVENIEEAHFVEWSAEELRVLEDINNCECLEELDRILGQYL